MGYPAPAPANFPARATERSKPCFRELPWIAVVAQSHKRPKSLWPKREPDISDLHARQDNAASRDPCKEKEKNMRRERAAMTCHTACDVWCVGAAAFPG